MRDRVSHAQRARAPVVILLGDEQPPIDATLVVEVIAGQLAECVIVYVRLDTQHAFVAVLCISAAGGPPVTGQPPNRCDARTLQCD